MQGTTEREEGGRRQRTPCHKGGCAAAHVFDTIHTTKTADKCCIQQTTTITTTTTTSSALRLNNCSNNGVQRVAASASACNSLLSAASASAVVAVVVKLCHVAHVRSMKIHFCFFGACNSSGSIIFTCISIKTHTHDDDDTVVVDDDDHLQPNDRTRHDRVGNYDHQGGQLSETHVHEPVL